MREDASAEPNLLTPVWRNGALLRDWSFAEVRANAALTPAASEQAA
jgi:hypothetical protein